MLKRKLSKPILTVIVFQIALAPVGARADQKAQKEAEKAYQQAMKACSKLPLVDQVKCIEKADTARRNATVSDPEAIGMFFLVVAGVAYLFHKLGGFVVVPTSILKNAAGIESGSGPQASRTQDKGEVEEGKTGALEEARPRETSPASSVGT